MPGVLCRAENGDSIRLLRIVDTSCEPNLVNQIGEPADREDDEEDKQPHPQAQEAVPEEWKNLIACDSPAHLRIRYSIPRADGTQAIPVICSALQGQRDLMGRDGAFAKNHPGVFPAGKIHDRGRDGAGSGSAVYDQRDFVAELIAHTTGPGALR